MERYTAHHVAGLEYKIKEANELVEAYKLRASRWRPYVRTMERDLKALRLVNGILFTLVIVLTGVIAYTN